MTKVKLEEKKHMASKTQNGYKMKLPFTKYTQQEMSHEKDVICFIVKGLGFIHPTTNKALKMQSVYEKFHKNIILLPKQIPKEKNERKSRDSFDYINI